MKQRLAWVGLGLSALVSTAAMAAGYGYGSGYGPGYGPGPGGFYFGASAGAAFYNEDGIPQLTPTIAMFRVGQQFNPYLAIEGRVGTSLSDGRADGYNVNIDALYAGYLKGILPITPWFSPYAIAGVGGAAIHRDYPDFHSNDAGLSYGGGLEFNLGGGASVNVEWARLITNGSNFGYDFTTDQLTFGVNWHPYLF
jgi:opacity protein-like surface antigen